MQEKHEFALRGCGSSIGIEELEGGIEAASLPPLVTLYLSASRVRAALAG